MIYDQHRMPYCALPSENIKIQFLGCPQRENKHVIAISRVVMGLCEAVDTEQQVSGG